MFVDRIRSARRPLTPWTVGLAAVALLAAAAPAAAQVVVFADAFEIGTPGRWSSTIPPSLPSCNCYFSGDCSGGFCDYASLPQEDNCTFAIPKPQSVPGAGCFEDHPGEFQLGICDGFCTSSANGSTLGGFDPAILAEGVELWSESVLRPSEAGGGPVDPDLAAAALALPIGEDQSIVLGRQVASLMSETAGIGFYDYFCHFEAGDPSTRFYVDLSVDKCRLMAGRLAAEALAAELLEPGTGAPILDGIAAYCPGGLPAFGANCAAGPTALTCLDARIRDLVVFLTTPRLDLLFGRVAGF
jgi:hypothetical protein